MDTAATNEKSQEQLNSPNMLAKQAKKEIRQLGITSVTCPKCKTSPEIIITERGERTIVTCKCGYIHDVDINF